MATIVTRSGKGSALTHTEVDANFNNLNNDKLETSAAYVHPNHTGDVTSTADGATVIADDVVDEANLKVSNSPTNGYFLSAQSGNTGGLTWAEVSSGGGSLDLYAENYDGTSTLPSATGTNSISVGPFSTSTAVNTVSIGSSADATADRAVSIGVNSSASGLRSIALGSSTANQSDAIAIGTGSSSLAVESTAIGHDAVASTGRQAMALGDSYASGADSFAAAIANNTSSYGATGANSVAIGYQSKATGADGQAIGDRSTASSTAAVALGYLSTASAAYSVAIGHANSSSGISATALGRSCQATGQRSLATGCESKAERRGKHAHAEGMFAAKGDAQHGLMVVKAQTADATPTTLTTVSSDQIILPNNSAYAFHGTIVARQQASAGTACAAWKVEGLIRREGSAGTTVLVNSATTVLDNTPAWGMALTADTTNGGLAITATGAASTNIRWVATINTSEVTY